MKRILSSSLIILCIYLFTPLGMLAQAEEPGINDFVFVDKEPSPTNISDIRNAIGYPEEAINDNTEGTVVIRVLVDETGNYVKHKIVKEIHPALAGAVESQIANVKFEPAMQEGKAVKYWVNLPFPFKLVDEEDIIREQIEELTQEIQVTPDNYELWHKRGVQRSRVRDYADAVVDFEESLRLNPRKNKKKKAKNTYEYLFYAQYSKGAAYVQMEKFEEAIADYDMALSYANEMAVEDEGVKETLSSLYLERGYAKGLSGNYEGAKKDYRWVIANDEDAKCGVYRLLADIGIEEKNYGELVEIYDGLLECDPGDEMLNYSRGFYKLKNGMDKESLSDFAIVTEKSDTRLMQIAAHNHAAMAYMNMGELDNALAELDKSFVLNSLLGQTYLFKAKILIKKGSREEACKVLRRGLAIGLEADELDEGEKLLKENCAE
ncbi:MAG: TonB family protein [Bacteroidia bacterium]|nr:TonB family protein [Bacteroidia bacterium]